MSKGVAGASRPQIFVGNNKKMLNEISESLKHLRVPEQGMPAGLVVPGSQGQPLAGSYANGNGSSNSAAIGGGGGGNGTAQGQAVQGQGDAPRLQQGARTRRAFGEFGGHGDKLKTIKDSLLVHEIGQDMPIMMDGGKGRSQHSPIPYDEEGLTSNKFSQLRLHHRGSDSPDSTRESSYASSADSSPIINNNGMTGYGFKRKSSVEDRGQQGMDPMQPYGHQTSRQKIYLGSDSTRSLSSLSSSNSLSDGRSSVSSVSQQQQQQSQHQYPSSYTSTMTINASPIPKTSAGPGTGDERYLQQQLKYYQGRSQDGSGQMHRAAGRAPQTGLQSTNHSRSGVLLERANPVANRLHVGRNGELIQSYVNPSGEGGGYVASLAMNRVPGGADPNYRTIIAPDDRAFKRQSQTVIISTSSSTTYTTEKQIHVSDPMSARDPPPYPQGRTYNVQAATAAAAQNQSTAQAKGYDLSCRHNTMSSGSLSGQTPSMSTHLNVPRVGSNAPNGQYTAQVPKVSSHLTIQQNPPPKEQHQSSAHIVIVPPDKQTYSPDMINAMINKTQPPPSYELSTQHRQASTSIQAHAGQMGGAIQRVGTPTMTQQQYNTARLTPQNSQSQGYSHNASGSGSMFKPIPSQMGGNVLRIETQPPQPQHQPHQPQPAVVTISRIEPSTDSAGGNKPPPPYRPAPTCLAQSSRVEMVQNDTHLKVPPLVPAVSTTTAHAGSNYTSPPILQSVRSTTVQKPVLQTAHGPDTVLPARGPSPDNISTHSSQSTHSSNRSGSPLIRPSSPISEISDISTEVESASSESQSLEKSRIESPVPERRHMGWHKEPRVRTYSPQAYKFYMEQHVENILKSHRQRITRRMQLEAEMQRVDLTDEDQDQMRRMLFQKESNYLRLKRAKMNKSMFKRITTLGIGAFGEVALAKKIDTSALYAIKKLRKRDVLMRNQAGHVKAERDILAEADNEWVVKLYYSFQDADNLYFVMDYIPGGDLMSLLIRLEIFEEELARFYIAELVLAIESVHKMGFIHRDIKPDNILIDRDGHIKLTDFGLCTGFRWTHDSKYYQSNPGGHSRQDSMEPFEMDEGKCQCGSHKHSNLDDAGKNFLKPLDRRRKKHQERCKAHSLVGTPNYIAPEVLAKSGYTQLCDWWSVGVILYEMLVGQPPFHADTPTETQVKVLHWKQCLHIPSQAQLSRDASDFILRLCTDQDQRLGRNGVMDVKAHPFFQTMDLDASLRKTKAPYVPKVRHAMDTSNFDCVSPDKLGSNSSADSWDSSPSDGVGGRRQQPDHAFFEFTFRRFFDDNGHPYPMPIDIDAPPDGPEEMERSEGDGAAEQTAIDLQEMVYV